MSFDDTDDILMLDCLSVGIETLARRVTLSVGCLGPSGGGGGEAAANPFLLFFSFFLSLFRGNYLRRRLDFAALARQKSERASERAERENEGQVGASHRKKTLKPSKSSS